MEENNVQLEKKYGLFMAAAMVIGIVIGSGVFFKAEKVLIATGGNLPQGLLAWFLGGLVMVICAYNFAILATHHEKVSGIVDYAEVLVGSTYGYAFAWFMATIYFPAMTSVLAWVSARYIGVLLGFDIVGPEVMTLAGFILISSYVTNTLSPKLSEKLQVSTTIIKLIPLFLMGIFGVFYGTTSGILVENFSGQVIGDVSGHPLFTAVVGTAFAYEGWICATSINAELRDAKKNLPRALVFGTVLVVIVYMVYYMGLGGAAANSVMMENGEQGAKLAFMNVFGEMAGTSLFVFVVISCLGTINGLMVACTRAFYSIAIRNEGPSPHVFKNIDPSTNMPTNSAVLGLMIAGLWLVYFYGANLTAPWFGVFSFDSSELPVITIYAMYIPIFYMQMKKATHLAPFTRYVVPALGIFSSLFMMVAAYVSYGVTVLYYIILYTVIMVIGFGLKKFNHVENTK
ncbi:MAG: APC family permease [Bacillota bacterium]